MTPEEAVAELRSQRIVVMDRSAVLARELFDAVQATETRRCAARVRLNLEAAPDMMLKPLGKKLANDLLITGGLEAED